MNAERWPQTSDADLSAVVDQVSSVVMGKPEAVRLALVCLMAEGHLLIEDLPGVGKTTLANALAHSVGLGLRRVQFTADLLPGDVTGALAPDAQSTRLVFRPGPIFTHLVVADELNRASPRTQSALLEAMEERQVSVDGDTHQLPRPFMVVATQNPTDPDGTYPLPHSQLDRFLMRISMGYPDRVSEAHLLDAGAQIDAAVVLPPLLDAEHMATIVDQVVQVHLAPAVRDYVLDLVAATRQHPALVVGASPRGALALVRAARASAHLAGRAYVLPDDVQSLAVPVLAHRMLVAPPAELSGATAAAIVADLVRHIPVPQRTRRL